MENQAYLFFIFILNGFLIGILFDIFRIIRKSFKTADLVTYIEDFLFWIISGTIVLYSIFKFNNGELRGFIFLGIILGALIYILVFSKTFIKINLYIINFIKKIVIYTLIIPIKFLYKIIKKLFIKPIVVTVINLRKTMSYFKIKLEKLRNKSIKKTKYKKDFT